MAGTFTHWMIVEDALDKCNRLATKHAYFPTILENNHFVILGAVGPDYPYLSELAKGLFKHHSWADRMHYENTGEFVRYGIANLASLNQQDFKFCLSWLCGYVTHILADSIIHPVVNAIVGPYIFNSSEHRHCEMIQDSYIFREIKKVEIAYAEYIELIKMCSDRNNEKRIYPALGDYWKRTLEMTHPGGSNKFDTIAPDDWHHNFLSVIGTVSDPPAIFRHMGEENNLVYKKTPDLSADERRKFIDAVNLPGNRTGVFKKDSFDKTVEKVMEVWQKLFVDVEKKNADNCSTYIRNWNFDTGVDEDRIYFWS